MNTSNTTTEALQVRLGDQLRRLRLARDLDQLTLADKAGVSEKALRNLEAGRGSSLSTLLQVLRALDRLDWLETLSRSEEHTSELQSLMRISYAVFCLKNK